MTETFAFALVLVGTSALTVVAVLLIAAALRRPGRPAQTARPTAEDAAFLFDGGALIDASPRGHALLESLRARNAHCDDWQSLTRFLLPDFPDLLAQLADLPENRRLRLPAAASGIEVLAEWLGGAIRLTLFDTRAESTGITLDRLSYHALQDELTLLRRLSESAPLPLWREGAGGVVTWANGAYLERLAQGPGGTAMAWPLPPLFPAGNPGPPHRVALPAPAGGRQAWFDVARLTDGDGVLAYALPADEAHQAERTKRDFVQTLTKAFATLPIGLAVFDRTRRLQMFNPALTDLTGLEPEFLLSRPGIEGFLNRMRDKRVLPEPRDFRAWSRRLLDIETVAPQGQFEETWNLPSGQTFRVSANPHPDGALAFLIEDITSETHLTRNVRAEMETSQSVLNLLDDAIAVFAPSGQLVLTNAAFSRLWTLDGEESLGAVTLSEALENWRDTGGDPSLWARITTLARPGQSERAVVQGPMTLADGECLTVEARRTSTGALMISFAHPLGRLAEPTPGQTPRAQVLRASA